MNRRSEQANRQKTVKGTMLSINLIGAALFLVVMGLFASWLYYLVLRNESIQSNKLMISTVSFEMERLLDIPINALSLELDQLEKFGDVSNDQSTHLLDETIVTYPMIDSIEVIDLDGKVVMYSSKEGYSTVGEDRSGQEYYKSTQGSSAVFISAPYIPTTKSTLHITLSVRGKQYIMAATVALADIRNTTQAFLGTMKHSNEIAIVDQSYTFVYDEDFRRVEQREQLHFRSRVEDLIANKADYDLIDCNGVTSFVSAIPVPKLGWIVISCYPYSDLASKVGQFASVLVLCFAGIFLMILFTSNYSYQKVITTITMLNEKIEAIRIGNYLTDIRKGQYKEYNDVINGFAKMASQLKTREEELYRLAYLDSLTGLPNRRSFIDRLSGTVDSCADVAVICMDLDNFKTINDSRGHYFGDMVLAKSAEKLCGLQAETCFVARMGGDEIYFLYVGYSSVGELTALAEQILEYISDPIMIDGTIVTVSASIGIAHTPIGGKTPTELMKNADLAMYKAKKHTNTKIVLFTADMAEELSYLSMLEEDLAKSLKSNEMTLVYQPILDVCSNAIVGLEALVRWKNPRFGLLSPISFIGIAEKTGYIHPLGKWIMATACLFAATLRNPPQQDLFVSVNVSPIEMLDPGFSSQVRAILEQTGLHPTKLCIEITENVVIMDFIKVSGILSDLRALGIRIALDDFGTGYSSMNYLNQIPADFIKIDKSFLDSVEGSDDILLAQIITLIRKLGMKAITEGVEHEKQIHLLQRLGSDYMQGYHLSRPIPEADFRNYLDAHIQ